MTVPHRASRPLVDPELDRILAALLGSPQWARRKYLRKQRYTRFLYKYRAVDPTAPTSVKHIADIIVESKLWMS